MTICTHRAFAPFTLSEENAPIPELPAGSDVFSHWLHHCSHNPWSPLSAEAAKPYQFIWQSWLRFLSAQHPDSVQAWAHATAVDVVTFINHGPQSPKSHKPSDITRRRYWRVLDRVYDHALLHDWIATNPAQGLTAQDLPPSEDPKGAILSPRMWRALKQQLPTPDDLITSRDRAVLMLLMELGLTPQEVRELEVRHLHYSEAPAHAITNIHIEGLRDCQSRSLPVSPALSQALQDWLRARAGYHAMQGMPALFCTRKAPQMSNHTLLHLVTKTLELAAQRHQLPAPARMGPQVLRNTVLVQWLESGLTVDEVLQRSGMKHPNALLHLRAFFLPDVSLYSA